MNDLYLQACDTVVVRCWGELLARHGLTLRRPYASGRPTYSDRADDDRQQHDGAADREQQPSLHD